jgi:SOS-response transcriptional repressor LexA
VSDQAGLSDAEWCAWWKKWPITRWLDDQSGTRWFRISDNIFHFHPKILKEHRLAFTRLTSELVDWRLAAWATSRGLAGEEGGSGVEFEASVVQVRGRAALRIKRQAVNDLPIGLVSVQVPDGRALQFQFASTYCKACFAESVQQNELPSLLMEWFGRDAGLPGTNQKVRFQNTGGRWSIAGLDSGRPTASVASADQTSATGIRIRKKVPRSEQYVRWAPVYDLVASAGSWGPTVAPEVQGWGEVSGTALSEGMFIARVQGHSMEPRIPDGAWCLFRPCPAGSREGRLLLVQIRGYSAADEESRFTVKRYRSQKESSDEGWVHQSIQLQSLNPAYPPMLLNSDNTEDLRIAGEFVRVLG